MPLQRIDNDSGMEPHQLRGQTEQGVMDVGEEEPRGHKGLHAAEAVAEDSVDVPTGQGVHTRAEVEEL